MAIIRLIMKPPPGKITKEKVAKIRPSTNVQRRALIRGTTVMPVDVPLDSGIVPAEWVTAPEAQKSDKDKAILYLHGGAYNLCGLNSHRPMLARISNATRLPVFAIDYRLAPEHACPAAIDDSIAAFLWLTSRQGGNYRAADIIVMGDSAGGGLSFATALKLRDDGHALPGAIVGMSPWVDLRCTSKSWQRNEPFDYLSKDEELKMSRWYAGKFPLEHPYVSPLYGDLRGLPPVLVHAGECETLVDEVRELAARCKDHGVQAQCQVYEDMTHVFQAFDYVPQAEKALGDIAAFLDKLPTHEIP